MGRWVEVINCAVVWDLLMAAISHLLRSVVFGVRMPVCGAVVLVKCLLWCVGCGQLCLVRQRSSAPWCLVVAQPASCIACGSRCQPGLLHHIEIVVIRTSKLTNALSGPVSVGRWGRME